jgi:IclR family acetate operon transcriptional repressor
VARLRIRCRRLRAARRRPPEDRRQKHENENLFYSLRYTEHPAPVNGFLHVPRLTQRAAAGYKSERAMAARNRIEVLIRAFRVLEAMARGATELREIAAQSRTGKSTAFRILYTLKELGYVEQATPASPYTLSWKMTALVRQAMGDRVLAQVARPHLVRLRDQLHEAAWLAELRRDRVVLTEGAQVSHKLRLSLDLGDACPLHATAVGKAVAAFLPQAVRRRLLGKPPWPRYTPRTIVSPAALEAELERVRRDGYAVNDEETVEGAFLAGAPVFDAEGRVCGAISVSAPTARCGAAKRRAMIESVRQAATELSQDLAALGYVSPYSAGGM